MDRDGALVLVGLPGSEIRGELDTAETLPTYFDALTERGSRQGGGVRTKRERRSGCPERPSQTAASAALQLQRLVPRLHDIEMQYICKVLERNHGNKPETARQLGISLKTLYNKLNALQEPPTALAG